VPGIAIEVVKLHASPSSVCCEILVKLNDADDTVLKVIDVIEVDGDGKITAIRAYKC